MRRYAVLRTLSILPTLLGVTVAVFLLIRLIPGTIVDQMIGTEGTYSEESVRALQAFFGLNVPLHVQYGRWLSRVVQGDLGISWRTGLPVLQMILSRLEVTAELSLGRHDWLPWCLAFRSAFFPPEWRTGRSIMRPGWRVCSVSRSRCFGRPR